MRLLRATFAHGRALSGRAPGQMMLPPTRPVTVNPKPERKARTRCRRLRPIPPLVYIYYMQRAETDAAAPPDAAATPSASPEKA